MIARPESINSLFGKMRRHRQKLPREGSFTRQLYDRILTGEVFELSSDQKMYSKQKCTLQRLVDDYGLELLHVGKRQVQWRG